MVLLVIKHRGFFLQGTYSFTWVLNHGAHSMVSHELSGDESRKIQW